MPGIKTLKSMNRQAGECNCKPLTKKTVNTIYKKLKTQPSENNPFFFY